MIGCDGFCTYPFPWWIVGTQVAAIAALTFLGARGWMHPAAARAGIRVAGAMLVLYAYIGGF